MSHVSAARLLDQFTALRRPQPRSELSAPEESFAEIAQAQQSARAMGLQTVRGREWPKSKVTPRDQRQSDEQSDDAQEEAVTDRQPRQGARRLDVSV